MKNYVGVSLDTESIEQPIIIHKDESFNPESLSKQEWGLSLIDDMATLCEGICTLIHLADQNGIIPSDMSLKSCINHLEQGFADADFKAKIIKK